jgi:hydrogenase expression/formation protein HypD
VVIAGFEPLDVMQAVLMLVRQVNDRAAPRSRTSSPAPSRAKATAPRRPWWPRSSSCASSFEWRGLGEVPYSALKIRPASRLRRRAPLRARLPAVPDHKQCECGAILRGVKRPTDCKLFGTVCTPDNPMGSVHGVVRRRLRGALRLRAWLRTSRSGRQG